MSVTGITHSLFQLLPEINFSDNSPKAAPIIKEEQGLQKYLSYLGITGSGTPPSASRYFATHVKTTGGATQAASAPLGLRPPIEGLEEAKRSSDAQISAIGILVEPLFDAIAKHGPENTHLWKGEYDKLVNDPYFQGLLRHYHGVYPGDPSAKGKHDYLRRSILVDEKRGVEIVFIHWRAGQSSRVHEHTHGDQPAYGVETLVYAGSGLVELRFEKQEGKETQVTARELQFGETLEVGSTPHQIINTSDDGHYTLNVYAWTPTAVASKATPKKTKVEGIRERPVAISDREARIAQEKLDRLVHKSVPSK